MFDMFIRDITTDEKGRIIVHLTEMAAPYVIDDNNKKMLRNVVGQILGEDLRLFEVSKTTCRVTVAEGKEKQCKEKLTEEMRKAFEMASDYMKSR